MAETVKEIKKKKAWIKIFASKQFGNVQVGETLVSEPKKVIGRLVEVSLDMLTNDSRKQYVRIFLKINDVKNEQAYGEFAKYQILDTHLRRMVKAGRSKILDSFKAKTKDKMVRIKPFILTRYKTTNPVGSRIRGETKKFLEEYLKEKNVTDFVDELVNGNVQRNLRMRLNKIYPINVCEIRMMEVLG